MHRTVQVAPSAKLAPGVVVGVAAQVAPGARIGQGPVVSARARVETDAVVGADAYLGPGVSLGPGSSVGSGTKLEDAAVVRWGVCAVERQYRDRQASGRAHSILQRGGSN